jgi:hypothetical protein
MNPRFGRKLYWSKFMCIFSSKNYRQMGLKTVTVTAPVYSIEASLILLASQGGRESSGGSDLTLHQSGQTHVP